MNRFGCGKPRATGKENRGWMRTLLPFCCSSTTVVVVNVFSISNATPRCRLLTSISPLCAFSFLPPRLAWVIMFRQEKETTGFPERRNQSITSILSGCPTSSANAQRTKRETSRREQIGEARTLQERRRKSECERRPQQYAVRSTSVRPHPNFRAEVEVRLL